MENNFHPSKGTNHHKNSSTDYSGNLVLPDKVRNLGLLLLIVGLLIGVLVYILEPERGAFSYLLTYVFILSVSLGGLFLIALEYIVGADWSVPFRRINEFYASLILLLVLLVIPLVFSLHSLYHWTHTDAMATDKILQGKSPYLNETFFIIRVFAFILIWVLFYLGFTRNSRKQDKTGDERLTKKNIKLAAAFIPLFALTITFSSIDWMMSLEPHWFSTIYGVYFFAGSVVTALSMVTITGVLLKEKSMLHPKIGEEHFYNLGSLLFAFVNFWGYIAFSQYILIWYANLPEETFWFIDRWSGNWIFGSLLLIVVHFVVPYALLLSQPSKMNFKRLRFVSIWLLAAHIIDLYWLIMPQMKGVESNFFYLLLEFGFPVASIGLLILVFYYNSKKHSILPKGDPKLNKGLNFRL